MITNRPYQDHCVSCVRNDHQLGYRRLLVVLPTAGGKTIVFSRIIKARAGNGPALVIAHTEELLEQAAKKIHMVWPGAKIGLVKAKANEWQCYDVVLASIQTISKDNRLKQIPQQYFSTIIIDEAHHATAGSYRKVQDHLAPNGSNVLVIGFTATPNRGDGAGLRKVFDKISFVKTIDEMIDEGWLVPARCEYINIQTDFSKIRTISGDFNLQDLGNEMNTEENNKAIIRAWWQLAWKQGRKRTIIFAVDIAHAETLNFWLNKTGVRSIVIHGKLLKQDRQQIIQDFHNGLYDVLVNCQILIEGFDDDHIDCVVMARPTQSQALYIQQAGRGLRPVLKPNGRANLEVKGDCIILDVVGNVINHKLVTMPTLYGKDYKTNTRQARDIARQGAPKRVKLKAYGNSRSINQASYTMFPWMVFNDEDWALQFPFKSLYFVRIWFNLNNGKWEYQHIFTGSFPVCQVMGEFEFKEEATATAEAHICTVTKPEKLSRQAYWRKHKISKKQKELLAKLNIELDGLDNLTTGEASDLISYIVTGRIISQLNSQKGRYTNGQSYQLTRVQEL